MKRISILTACMLLALAVFAQTAREEIKADIYKSASNHMAYPGPQKVLTACPEGKKPFYISYTNINFVKKMNELILNYLLFEFLINVHDYQKIFLI